jgi:hypothetical protein
MLRRAKKTLTWHSLDTSVRFFVYLTALSHVHWVCRIKQGNEWHVIRKFKVSISTTEIEQLIKWEYSHELLVCKNWEGCWLGLSEDTVPEFFRKYWTKLWQNLIRRVGFREWLNKCYGFSVLRATRPSKINLKVSVHCTTCFDRHCSSSGV